VGGSRKNQAGRPREATLLIQLEGGGPGKRAYDRVGINFGKLILRENRSVPVWQQAQLRKEDGKTSSSDKASRREFVPV